MNYIGISWQIKNRKEDFALEQRLMNCERSGKYRQTPERRRSLLGGIVVKKAHRRENSINHLGGNYC